MIVRRGCVWSRLWRAEIDQGEAGMSLKAFHVFFVVVSTLLAVGFGLWAISDFRSNGDVASLVCGIGSLIGGVGLVGYGRWFMRKLKDVSYL